jgi:hypothetical protein
MSAPSSVSRFTRKSVGLAWPGLASLLVALTLAGSLASCGGGSSGTETAADPGTLASTSYAQGPVSGFGSVIVGGVRFDDSVAKVLDEDGSAMSLSAVKLGTMVQVDAGKLSVDASTSQSTAQARQFRIGRELLGPVGSIDKAASTLKVLDQTVVVTTSTVFDSTLAGGLSALTVGAVIEVHGIPDPIKGNITATRIEPKLAAPAYALRGTVAALDATAKTFKLGGATISYAGVAAADLAPNLANGVLVRALLKPAPVAGVWAALTVRSGVRAPAEGSPAPRDAHVEGVITAFTSSASFEVNGLKVDASKATFPDGTATLLLGAKVEVMGSVVAGVLVATKVQLDKPEGGEGGGGPRPLELHGAISALDTTAKTFTLRNATVSYSGSVIYKNGTEANLANAKNVDVYGVLSADRTRVQAQRIEFKSGS